MNTTPAPAPSRILQRIRVLGAVVSLSLLTFALVFLYRELDHLDYARLMASAALTNGTQIGLALLFTALSYALLTGYDATAMRYAGPAIPYRKIALVSFIACAVGMNVGYSALSGGTIRYRLYSALGVTASDIAKIVLFTTATFALGASSLVGVTLLLSSAGHVVLGLPNEAVRTLGAAMLAFPMLYLTVSWSGRAKLRVGFWELPIPTPRIAVTQILLASADILSASMVLYVLIEPVAGVDYPSFLAIYLVAMVAGLLSGVPGGLGVFEAVIIAALPHGDKVQTLGLVILYRLLYYAVPLMLAAIGFAWQELRHHGEAIGSAARRSATLILSTGPLLTAVSTFLAGTVLTVSGSMPGLESRIHLVAKAIPLPLLELSHLAGSVCGLCLLILAHGLYRRLRNAYVAVVALLVGGIAASLFKGLEYEAALLLGGVLVLVWLSRREFYRTGSIGSDRPTLVWMVAITTVLVVAIWIGFISYRHVEYRQLLWWQFSVDAGASRMLRSTLLLGITVLGFAVYRLLRSEKPQAADAAPADYEQVKAVLRASAESSANVALLGDKRFVWSEDGSAFVMYQVSGRSWIAMGAPVGNESAFEDVAWRFLELVDRHDGRPVFYQIGEDFLPACVDMGLSLSKLGEDARVSLQDFALEGSARAELRQAVNRAKRFDLVFEIVPRVEVPAILADLRRVSDSWLEDKTAAEKGFSLGAFIDGYVSEFDCAVVRSGDEIVAFANLWLTESDREASIDMMRYSNEAPKGIMDYLFVELLLWSKAQGYQWFSLGMAPLSGLEERPLAPLWHRIGTLVFKHGENFYNFEGLRRYKEKFLPQWEPKYLACPPGPFNLAAALFDASLLISRGVRRTADSAADRARVDG